MVSFLVLTINCINVRLGRGHETMIYYFGYILLLSYYNNTPIEHVSKKIKPSPLELLKFGRAPAAMYTAVSHYKPKLKCENNIIL